MSAEMTPAAKELVTAVEHLRGAVHALRQCVSLLRQTVQVVPASVADALSLVEHFAAGESICVVLRDNIIEGNVVEGTLNPWAKPSPLPLSEALLLPHSPCWRLM